MALLRRFFPFLSWFENYKLAYLRIDFISGLTVALVLVPQSMAYAQLAGLPAYYGLYAALLPPLIASLFGSSRQLATGPVAVVSLMTSAALEPLATIGTEEFIAYALLLAFFVGVFQFTLGLLRLGVIVNFLSHPVTNGFTNAAAIIIATSQLSKVFGVYVDKAPHHYETVIRVVMAAIEFSHWPTIGMAVLSFSTMIVLRRINPRIPNVLIAVVITILLSWLLEFERNQTVSIQQIQSPHVNQLVQNFNTAISMRTTLEKARSTTQKSWAKIQTDHESICLRCHAERSPLLFESQIDTDTSLAPVGPGSLLALHNQSGLLDSHITEIKKEISQARTKLRDIFLVQLDTHQEKGIFYVRGEQPSSATLTNEQWRIKVGNKALSSQTLILISGGAVVAHIPEGLPSLSFPHFDWTVAPQLIMAALIISLLGFMEAISIAKAMAARTRQKLDANQELIGQGLANIVGCMAQSYAVSGSFSRSAVNLQAGAKTGLSNVFSSAFVMIVLLFFSKTLYYLPQAVLATIIMMAVFGLLNVSGFKHAWRTSRVDGIVSLVTFGGTLVFAPHLEWGIMLGVVLSLGAYLYRSTRPHLAQLAPHPDGTMRDVKRHQLATCHHIAVVRFEGPLYFASANYLESEILSRVAEMPDLRHLLIVGNGISEVDASGEEMLKHVVENLRNAGYAVSFSGLSDQVIDVLKRSHLYQEIGDAYFYSTRSEAIASIFGPAHEASEEDNCPFHQAMPPVVELSLDEDGSLRNAERHQLTVCRHIAALRFDAPLNFANTAFLKQEILNRFIDRPTLRHVLFVSHGINDVDEFGAAKLMDLVSSLKSNGFAVSFSGLKEEVIDALAHNGLLEVIGSGHIYPTQLTAIASLYATAHAGSSETNCPLRDIAPRLTELSWHHTGTLRDVEQHHLETCTKIGVLRLEGPLVLFNQKAIQSEFIRWAKTRPEVECVVFIVNAIHKLERNEQENLCALVAAVKEASYRVVLASFSDRVFEQLGRNGYIDKIGVEDIYPTVASAIASVFHEVHEQTFQLECPLQGLLPRMKQLAFHADGSLRDAQRSNLALCEHIVAIRFDGPLDFATIAYFEHGLLNILERFEHAKHIIFAAHTLTRLDPVGAEELCDLVERLEKQGYVFAFSGLKDEELDVLALTRRHKNIEQHIIFPTQVKAVKELYEQAHQNNREEKCPLLEVVHTKSTTKFND